MSKRKPSLDPVEDALRAAAQLEEWGKGPFGYSINEQTILVLATEVTRLRRIVKTRG